MPKQNVTLTVNLPWRRAGRETTRRQAMAQVAGAKDAQLVAVNPGTKTTQSLVFSVTY